MAISWDPGRFAGVPVVVVGDVMLDHYVSGAVGRVSDEAPVPILRVHSERWVLGGAANVAANIVALGGAATLIGVVGSDADGRRLEEMLATPHGEIAGRLVADPSVPTVRKTRYMGGQQQMLRVDREVDAAPLDATQEALIGRVRAALAEARVLILSDYGKGALADAVLAGVRDLARRVGATVIVDPKRSNYADYAGAGYITPNRRELTLAAGLPSETDSEAEAAARVASDAAGGASILLTRSEKGMSLFRPGRSPLHAAAQAREVFDVSGAGDTVVACFGLALAAGLHEADAMTLANAAAGLVVEKRGTAVATLAEVAARLEGGREGSTETTRLLSWSEAERQRADWARAGLSVGFANGCFDLIHPGHVSLLAQAAASCDRLIVALNSDASVTRLKGPDRPVQSQAARAVVMAGLKGVAAVVLFEEDTPERLIETLAPDLLVKGADYAEAEVVGAALVKARGGRVLLAELTPGQSTSKLIARSPS